MVSMMNNCKLEQKSDLIPIETPPFQTKSPSKRAIMDSSDSLEENLMHSSNGIISGGDKIDGAVGVSPEVVKEGLDEKVEARVLDNLQAVNGNDTVHVEPDKTEPENARVSSEADSGGMKKESSVALEFDSTETDSRVSTEFGSTEIKSRVSEMKAEGVKRDQSSVNVESDLGAVRTITEERAEISFGEALGSEAEKALSCGFEPGDMVWGKVKSHPWWPGQIFNEALATSSVRRTKREGHILVAFFGDSSYGWFDPAELIPFDPNYAEKSQQSNSRFFIRAVEEAIDESRRRAALGLICCCRNPYNFQQTKVQGYFEVDVVGYEPGGIFSTKQIKKSRNNFEPLEALSFVHQLAMSTWGNDQKGINSVKNVAMLLALRRATFEEFDETYAQAFGAQPIRPSHDSMARTEQLAKGPSRAPLSGPMVMAEALGDMKSYSKPSKVKDQSKKNNNVLKKKDKLGKGTNSILQKKTSTVSMKPQDIPKQDGNQTISRGVIALSSRESGQGSETTGEKLVVGKTRVDDGQTHVKRLDMAAPASVGLQMNKPSDEGMSVLHEINERAAPIANVNPKDRNLHDSGVVGRSEAATNVPSGSSLSEGSEQSKQSLDDHSEPDELGKLGEGVLGTNSDGVVKKGKVLKHPKKLSSGKTGKLEKNVKKKRKLEEVLEDRPRKVPKTLKIEGSVVESTEISSTQRNDDGAGLSSDSVLASPRVDLATVKLELPELIDDLLALATDPFHGIERNSPKIVKNTLLQFRSLVYQMKVAPVTTTEARTSELDVIAMTPLSKKPKDPYPASRKPVGRPDDPTISGRKRSLSGRQEEKAAKRVQRVDELKSLTTEKKTVSKKVQALKLVEQKEARITGQKKPIKVDTTPKKPEPVARVVEPAMLSLKFPYRTNLPSIPELKARFARFGPLDQSGFRVFWKTFTCRVVFKNKSHALAAYNHAIQNNLFGQVRVNYQVRDVAAPAAEMPKSSKLEDASDKVPPIKHGLMQQHTQQSPAVPLKSCLKKPSRDETGLVLNGDPRESPRVRFNLSNEESGGAGGGGGSSLSSSFAMDVNNNNFRKVIPQSQPLLSLNNQNGGSSSSSSFEANVNQRIGHLPKSPSPYIHQPNDHRYHTWNQVQVEEEKNRNNTHNSTCTNKTDISSQMLSLMVKCNDIVMDITSSLGYSPYHSL